MWLYSSKERYVSGLVSESRSSHVTFCGSVLIRDRIVSSKGVAYSVPAWFRAVSGTNFIKRGKIAWLSRTVVRVLTQFIRGALGSRFGRVMCISSHLTSVPYPPVESEFYFFYKCFTPLQVCRMLNGFFTMRLICLAHPLSFQKFSLLLKELIFLCFIMK